MDMNESRRSFIAGGAILAAAGVLGASGVEGEGPQTDLNKVTYTVRPVGVIRNRKGESVKLEIFEKYAPSLLRMEHCKSVMVVWWFDKNDTPEKRGILRVHPRGNTDNPLTGVFATHSPFRPNLIALTPCKVLGVEGSTIIVDSIDAFDGTPILDIKSW